MKYFILISLFVFSVVQAQPINELPDSVFNEYMDNMILEGDTGTAEYFDNMILPLDSNEVTPIENKAIKADHGYGMWEDVFGWWGYVALALFVGLIVTVAILSS